MRDRSGAGGAQVARNAAAMISARLVAVGTVLATTPVLFSVLGAREFGVWALLLGLVAVASLADLGLASAQVRQVARSAATGDVRAIQAAAALAIGIAVGLAAVLFACISLGWSALGALLDLGDLSTPARHASLLLVAAIAVDGLASPWRAALEGSQRMRPLAAVTAAGSLVDGVLGVTFVVLGAGIKGLAAAALCAAILRAALVVRLAARRGVSVRPSLAALDRAELRRLLGYGGRVQATSTASALNVDADRLVLAGVASPVLVASFEVASRLLGTLRLLSWYVLTALFPAAAALHAAGRRDLLDRLYLRTTRYLAALALVGAAALVVSAEPLVAAWIGQPVPFAVISVALLAPAYALALTSGPAAAVRRAEGAPGLETRWALVAVAANIALTIPLVLAFGAVGVPLGSAVAWILATLGFLWRFHRTTGRPLAPFGQAVWKPLAAACLAAVGGWTAAGLLPDLPGRLGATVVATALASLAVVVGIGALAMLRFFEAEELQRLRRVLRSVAALLRPPPGAPARRTS